MRLTKQRYFLTYIITGLLLAVMLLATGCGGNHTSSGGLAADKSAMKKPPKPPPEPGNPAIVYWAGGGGIMVMDADGSHQTKLGVNFGEDPCWSPDGDQIAFHTNGDFSLYTVNVDGSGLQEILDLHLGAVENPAWSPVAIPDRDFRIAFDGRQTPGIPDHDLGLVDPAGNVLEYLTSTPDISESHPIWSPDATRMAYKTYWKDDSSGITYRDIYVRDLATGEASRVDIGGPFAGRDVAMVALDWARTQDKIAFAGATSEPAGDNVRNAYEIWVVDLADPANPVQLTNDPSVCFASPSWSPDDSEIVYHKGDILVNAWGCEIWKMNADGSGKTLLLKPAKRIKTASWPDWKR